MEISVIIRNISSNEINAFKADQNRTDNDGLCSELTVLQHGHSLLVFTYFKDR